MVSVGHDTPPTPRASPNPIRRILYVMPNTRRLAGVESVVHDVASELAVRYGKRFEVDVLFTSHIEGLPADTAYHAIRRSVTGRLDLLRTLRSVVRAGHYDLAVVTQVEATVLVWLSCLFLRPRLVAYLHGNVDREQSHWKAHLLFFLMRALVLRRLTAVFGVSPTQLDAFRDKFEGGCPHAWVPNPVRRFASAEGERRRRDGPVAFVSVARFAYQKGHDLLIDAFAELHRARPHTRLILVGYGRLEGEVRDAVAARGLDGAVSIEVGLTTPETALAAADIYVSASRWEGWGLAICEALRFGLPVIATDCPFGPSDILTDVRLGRLVPLGRRDALAEAMIHYVDHLDAEAGHAAFRKAHVDQFSLERVVHRHAAALLAATPAPASTTRLQGATV